ncbi:unnamed protein product [Alopecurus aequalis]
MHMSMGSMVAPHPHVVVIGFPFASHAVKLFRVARALAAASPTVTFSFACTATILARLNNVPGNIRLVEVPEADADGGEGGLGVRVWRFMASAEAGGIKQALQAAGGGGGKVTCVVSDALVWMAGEEAAAVAATWVPVWTGGPGGLLAHLSGDALRLGLGNGNGDGDGDELLTSHLGLGDYRARDLPGEVVSGGPEEAMFRRIADTISKFATAAVAFNTFQGLVPPEVMDALATMLPSCLTVGPFHLLPGTESPDTDGAPADPYGCLAWLDGHPARAVAYVSFGTIALEMTAPEELCELAYGLEAAGKPFLWSLPEESWPLLPPGFMERAGAAGLGLVVPWAPQVQVLRHASVGAFVSHAGWASVLEAMSSGVPMACRPFFGDQRMNARLLHLRGLGTTLEAPLTRKGVASVVAALLSAEEGGEGMWARTQELRGMAATAFAPGGASRNSLDKLVHIVCQRT